MSSASQDDDPVIALLNITFGVGLSFLSALTIWCLWGWFAVPLGAPTVNYWHAFGLGLFGSWLVTMNLRDFSKQDQETVLTRILGKAIIYAILIGCGALVHLGVAK